MAKFYQTDVRILEHKTVLPGYKSLFFSHPTLAKNARPGQFLLLDCGTFFRRPFTISSVKGIIIEILYKVIGKGTRYLSEKKKGDWLNVFGPLGNGFNPSPQGERTSPENLVFVAGGTGIASLRFLAQKISVPGVLFYGAKTKNDIIGLDVFKQKKWHIKISTEDCSSGSKGLVTDTFKKYLSGSRHLPSYLYSAGPKPMLKRISEICISNGIAGQVSLEEIIACGVGACRGCAVKTAVKTNKFIYKTVCKDGPVFDIREILWD